MHEEGLFNKTLYSNIFDLKNRVIYLNHWHQFDEVVVLNVEEELTKARYNIRIKDLFSQATVGKASRAHFGFIATLCIGIVGGTVIMVAAPHFIKKRILNGGMGN